MNATGKYSLILAMLFLCLCINLSAISSAQVNPDTPSILVKIPFASIAQRDEIINSGLDITGAEKNSLKAILTKSQLDELLNKGIKVTVIADDYRSLSPYYKKAFPSYYHNYTSIKNTFQNAATNNPAFIKYYVIGKSVQNRDIIAVKITDNPETEEAEPEVRLAALHHGNELSSSEFALYFLNYVVSKYNSGDDEITRMVNSTEIWIIPMVNPDGMMSSPSPSRYSANGYDLNRNYICPSDEHDALGGPYPFSEPEIRAVRDISMPTGNTINNSFVIGLTYHAGEICFNYVWNYTPTLTPDNSVLVEQGTKYTNYVKDAGLTGFWLTNGYAWYKTVGDLNDWSYQFCGTLDTTVEMTSDYHPAVTSQSGIDAFCEDQLRGTLYSIWLAGEGIRGTVVDAFSRKPVFATINVTQNGKAVYNDPTKCGDFYKILLPGTYTVEVSAAGYQTQTFTSVVAGAWKAEQKERNFTDLGEIRLVNTKAKSGKIWILK